MKRVLFAFSALLPWTFFANAITSSGNSIVGSAHLITKVYFPRPIIPVASVCAGLIDLAVAFPMLVVLMFYYHIGITVNVLFLVPLVLLALSIVLELLLTAFARQWFAASGFARAVGLLRAAAGVVPVTGP